MSGPAGSRAALWLAPATTVAATIVLGWILWRPTPFPGLVLTPYLYLSANAPEYDRFDVDHPISVSLSIALPNPVKGTTAIVAGVQLFSPGTVHVRKLTRDGVTVSPIRTGAADFGGFWDDQKHGLYHLQFGEWRLIPLDLASVGNGIWELVEISPWGANSEVRFDPVTHQKTVIEHPDHEVTSFTLDQPGLYSLQVEYHYRGPYLPDQPGVLGLDDIYWDALLSNEATFRLR